jgi:TIR domain-containing protein
MGPASTFISHRAEYGAIARGLKEVIETGAQQKIEVFISEDIARGKQWRQSIEEQLRKADSLFLIYGAPYEDWSWCFYEAGYFTALEPKSRARRIYCVTRPDVAPPGPLSHLQMVTTKDQLITELAALYRRSAIEPDAAGLRPLVTKLENRLFGQIREFEGYSRLYFRTTEADLAASQGLPANAFLTGDSVVLGDLFSIASPSIAWEDVLAVADTAEGNTNFMSKWIDETTKIILASRKNQLIAPQSVLIGRSGRRYRTLLYNARLQADGNFCCEFLVIDEVGGPAVGLTRQQLSLLTSIRMGFRFRSELVLKFPNDFDDLSEEERLARIRGIPRIIASLTTESETRGDINQNDFLEAFDTEEGERLRKLLNYWPLLHRELMRSLGLSPEGKPISDRGLMGANVDRYRTAFEALRLLNIEYLSRCCARVSKMMMKSESELKDNAKIIDQAVKTLKAPELKAA